MNKKIPVIVCVDAEPDKRLFEPGSLEPWRGLEKTAVFFRSARPRLASVTGSPPHFSWFFRMDPQVEVGWGAPDWGVRNYRELVNEFEQNGDEIGLHTHAWRWDREARRWIVDHGDQRWVEHCVDVSFRAFLESFGRPCRSFRFGDAWLNNQTARFLETLGVHFDLTLEAGKKPRRAERKNEIVTGAVPDLTPVPLFPFRPSREDFRTPDPSRTDGMWMIPVSTGSFTDRRGVFETAYCALFDRKRLRPKFRTLRLAINPQAFAQGIERILRSSEEPLLVLEVRSCVTLYPHRFEHLKKNIDQLLSHRDARRFVISTPAEALDLIGVTRR